MNSKALRRNPFVSQVNFNAEMLIEMVRDSVSSNPFVSQFNFNRVYKIITDIKKSVEIPT